MEMNWIDVDDALPDWGLTPVLAMLSAEGENFYTFEVVMFVGGRWFFNSDGSEVKKVRGEPMPNCEEWWPVKVVKWIPIPDA